MIALLFVAGLAGAAPADRPVGRETTIEFASNGGLRDWQRGPAGSDIVYVRDRTERWYQVTLTGPCARYATQDALVYTTDNNGTFDTFSRVSVPRQMPGAVCGVTSIKTSLPPPGQPGARKHRR